MTETRTERTGRPSLPATAAGKGLGSLPIGSPHSRAAARALVAARQASEAESEWDKEPDCTGLAECVADARQRAAHGRVLPHDCSPIQIPPGKENTLRGRLAARINEARARVASFEAEREAEQ